MKSKIAIVSFVEKVRTLDFQKMYDKMYASIMMSIMISNLTFQRGTGSIAYDATSILI